MVMFRKPFNSKVTIIAMSIIFLCNTVLYARDTLRVPLGHYGRIGSAITKRPEFIANKQSVQWVLTGRADSKNIDDWVFDNTAIEDLLDDYKKHIEINLPEQLPSRKQIKTMLARINLLFKGRIGICAEFSGALCYILKDLPYVEEIKLMRTKDNKHSWLLIGFKGDPKWYVFDRGIGQMTKYRKDNKFGNYLPLEEAQKIAKWYSTEDSYEIVYEDEELFDLVLPKNRMASSLSVKDIKADVLYDYINENIKAQDLYKKLCSKIKPELLNLFIAENKKEMGFQYCVEIIKELQSWMKKDPDSKSLIPMIFCTGNTPWVGYMFLGEILNSWWEKDTQELLKANGIDESSKPDMTRVLAFPMDAVLFQKREAYYAFANILNNMFDGIGIIKKHRRFFYGDLIINKNNKGYRKMRAKEFEELMEDVRKNGLQLELPDKKTGTAKITAPEDSIQWRCLKAIESHALDLDKELRERSGAMITTSGIGPAELEKGDGHVGFNDYETRHAHNGLAYIAPAPFYVRAAHGGEDQGIKGTFVEKDGNIISTMGVITFSLASLFYRQDPKGGL